MSTRTLRVNELIQREMSELLRRRHRDEAAAITILGVEVTPDLHEAKVFVAITGDAEQTALHLRWLRKHAQEIRFALGRTIVLKHMPVFTFVLDEAVDRGNRILEVMDEIAARDAAHPPQLAPEQPAPTETPPAAPNAKSSPAASLPAASLPAASAAAQPERA